MPNRVLLSSFFFPGVGLSSVDVSAGKEAQARNSIGLFTVDPFSPLLFLSVGH